MSKIPQGEWNAIAARYAQGESISRIAQSYGCTPPAIHYILKRNRQRAAGIIEQHQNGTPAAALSARANAQEAENAQEALKEEPLKQEPRKQELRAPEIPGAIGSRGAEPRFSQLLPGKGEAIRARAAEPTTGRGIGPVKPPSERSQPAAAPQHTGSRSTARGSALTAGLDSELHGHAEAAIEAFRSSFDAALAEGSPVLRRQLRQAASDLMRVAARTTIVLDRLSAGPERTS